MKSTFVSSCKKACLMAALAIGFSVSAMAVDTVVLNGATVRLPSPDATLIRTAQTPSEVKLLVPVAVTNTTCIEHGSVTRTGYNGAECGYDSRPVRVCRIEGRMCRDNRDGRHECTGGVQRCYMTTQSEPRYCSWQESVCTREGPVTSTEEKETTLKFKIDALVGAEEETYAFSGRQVKMDGQKTTYALTAISTKKPVSISGDGGTIKIKNP